jgi:hypothetical protein
MGAAVISSERVRQHRERKRHGRVQLTIEADEVALPTALVEAKYLAPNLADEGKRSNTHCSG